MIVSLSDGTPANIIKNDNNTYEILEQEKERTLGFIGLMAKLMGWDACTEKWCFSNLKLYRFKKESMSVSTTPRLNQGSYKEMVESNCFSMAITAGSTIEYTRDVEGFFRK